VTLSGKVFSPNPILLYILIRRLSGTSAHICGPRPFSFDNSTELKNSKGVPSPYVAMSNDAKKEKD